MEFTLSCLCYLCKAWIAKAIAGMIVTAMNIILIGFMGTGKSAVGRNLARRLEARHLDTDAEIEREAGKPIPQIFAEEGEAAFRARETGLLSSLAPPLLGAGGPSLILSTGGGTPLRAENAALLKQIGAIIWLRVTPEAILARVEEHLRERPLLSGHADDPLGRIQALMAAREPRYAALADYELDTSGCADADEAAGKLLELVTSHIQK